MINFLIIFLIIIFESLIIYFLMKNNRTDCRLCDSLWISFVINVFTLIFVEFLSNFSLTQNISNSFSFHYVLFFIVFHLFVSSIIFSIYFKINNINYSGFYHSKSFDKSKNKISKIRNSLFLKDIYIFKIKIPLVLIIYSNLSVLFFMLTLLVFFEFI